MCSLYTKWLHSKGSKSLMKKCLFSGQAAHLAASPDPLSDPKASQQISQVVRKTPMEKSLGNIHLPYLFSSSCSYCLSRDSRDSLLIPSFSSREAFLKGKSVILEVENKRNRVAQ